MRQVTIQLPEGAPSEWSTLLLVRVGAEISGLSAAHLESIKDELRNRANGTAAIFNDGRFHSATIGAVATVSDRTDWQSIAKELLATVDNDKRVELLARYTKPGITPKQRVTFK